MRSVSGGAVMGARACVCRFSRTQTFMTLSTTEADYVALTATIIRLFSCGTCGVLSYLVLVLHAARFSRTTSGQGTWLITLCARRI